MEYITCITKYIDKLLETVDIMECAIYNVKCIEIVLNNINIIENQLRNINNANIVSIKKLYDETQHLINIIEENISKVLEFCVNNNIDLKCAKERLLNMKIKMISIKNILNKIDRNLKFLYTADNCAHSA